MSKDLIRRGRVGLGKSIVRSVWQVCIHTYIYVCVRIYFVIFFFFMCLLVKILIWRMHVVLGKTIWRFFVVGTVHSHL